MWYQMMWLMCHRKLMWWRIVLLICHCSINWDLPPRYDGCTDDVMLEALVVEDHVANLQQECAICVTNARGMAFLCGHTTCGMWGKIGQVSHLPGTDQLPYQVVLGVTMPRELLLMNV